jgi:uroporphyrinogen decarboxylase
LTLFFAVFDVFSCHREAGQEWKMMTPRERWMALFRGERPDRVPCDYWGTGEITTRLLHDLGCESERALWQKLGIDKCVLLGPRHPKAKETGWHLPSLFSLFGIETRNIEYGDGIGVYEEVASSPLAHAETVAEINDCPWPNPRDFDYSALRAECAQYHPEYPVLGVSYEPFYLYCRLRGMERALEDIGGNPEFADALMERIFDLFAAIVRNSIEAAGEHFDFVYVAEDLGTQESLLMSPRSIRRFILPWLTKMAEITHAAGKLVFHHDDGAIRPMIPDLIRAGVDVLNPIQWRCKGMEREGLARDFGASLVFHGGVDNQGTLPFGTSEDVRREVADNIRIFRECKGYVVASCHNLQSNTPTENVVAMYRAVDEFGWNRG